VVRRRPGNEPHDAGLHRVRLDGRIAEDEVGKAAEGGLCEVSGATPRVSHAWAKKTGGHKERMEGREGTPQEVKTSIFDLNDAKLENKSMEQKGIVFFDLLPLSQTEMQSNVTKKKKRKMEYEPKCFIKSLCCAMIGSDEFIPEFRDKGEAITFVKTCNCLHLFIFMHLPYICKKNCAHILKFVT
jgi:hypothetical protein